METPPILALIAVFVAVLMFLEGGYLLWRDRFGMGQRQTNRRMAMIRESQSRRVALRKLQRQRGPLEAMCMRLVPHLEKLLVEAGSLLPVSTLLGVMAGAAFVTATLISSLLGAPFIIGMAAGAVLGTGGPILYFIRRRAQRVMAFAQQLPQAIDLIVRGVQVGHPVPAALGLVAKQMPDPIGSEFGLVVDEISYGRSIVEALSDMAQRVPQPDLRYLVTVIEIHNQSGGNLVAEILRNLSGVIRARFHMFAKIRATSAEGRMSAIAIGLMPIIIAIILSIIKPDYFSAVSHHRLFWPIMGATPVMLISGWVTIWRLVNFKV